MSVETKSSHGPRHDDGAVSAGAVERVVEKILRLFEWAGRLIALFMLGSTSYAVFMRYVVKDPCRRVEELTGYLVIGLVVLGAPTVLLENKHIEVDLLTGSLQGKLLKAVRLWAMVTVILFCSAVIYSGWRTAKLSYQFGMLGEGYIEAPLWIPQGVMSVGFVLMLIAAVARIISLLVREKK
jgi:C4-dicarboxylate transporter DctQ subunit